MNRRNWLVGIAVTSTLLGGHAPICDQDTLLAQTVIEIQNQTSSKQSEALNKQASDIVDSPEYLTDEIIPQRSQTILQDSWIRTIPIVEEQLVTLRTQFGDNHPEVAKQLSLLATLYIQQQRATDAETVAREALEIYRGLPEPYSVERALLLSNLAGIADLRGQPNQAESFYQQALDILQEEPGERADLIPHIQTQLALLREAQGEDSGTANSSNAPIPHDDVESFLAQAVEAARSSDDQLRLSDSIDTLASYYHRRGRYDEAEALYQETLKIRRGWNHEGIQNPNTARSLNNLALLYQGQGYYEEAEALYQEAIEIYEDYIASISTISGGDYIAPLIHEQMVPTYYNFAGLYRATGKIAQAVHALQTGMDIEEQNLDTRLANLGESDRLAYVAQLADTINYVISLNLDAAPDSSDTKQLALIALLRRKGRLLEAGTRVQEIVRERATPKDVELLARLNQIRQEISNLGLQPPTNLSATESQTRLAQLRSEVNQLETILARRSADLALDSQSININAIQAKIPNNSVLVEYALYQPFDPKNPVSEQINHEDITAPGSNRFGELRYAAYLLFPGGHIEAIDLGDATQIDTAIQSFTALLQKRRANFRSNNTATITPRVRDDIIETTTGTLRTLLLDPIAPHLTDIDHLLISPDSQLNRLPFEALQIEPGGDYLIQRYQISYLNSGRDLLKLNITEPITNPAVILANPNYDTADASVEIAAALPSPASEPPRATRATHHRSTDLSDLHVTPLPGTQAEVDAIQPLLPNATILTGAQATENSLKTVQSPRILHIATHGFFLSDLDRPIPDPTETLLASTPSTPAIPITENPLLRSGLILAGFNLRSSGSEDGVLTALEASNLNLSGTQLVVLSACDTGLGDIANGEGVYGLRRAFSLAGAESQLISLWQVSDDGTQNLMAQYYERLINQGMGRSEALRQVQLDLIESGGEYSHPYYWAAFILTGDWRSLE